MKKFAFAIKNLSYEQEKAINEYFDGTYGWWHWFDGFWLITDASNTLTTSSINETIGNIAPEKWRMVVEVGDSNNWSGYGPNGEEKNMFEWLEDSWK